MFSRLLFPGLILIGTLLLAKAADTRPSILYCLADDWGWPHAGGHQSEMIRRLDVCLGPDAGRPSPVTAPRSALRN